MSKAAAGVACGLILDPETDSHTSGISPAPKYQVLSDITVQYKLINVHVQCVLL